LALLVVGPKVHDAAGGVIGEPEGEPAVGLRSDLVEAIQGHGGLARAAQAPDDPQFAACDHSLIDDDVG
jgi:hypothetical protein